MKRLLSITLLPVFSSFLSLLACPSLADTDSQAHAEQSQTLDPDVESILDRVQAAAKEVTSLKAGLRYDTISELTGDQKRRFGSLVYVAAEDDAGNDGVGTPTRFFVHFKVLFVDGGKNGRDLDTTYIYDGQDVAEIDRQSRSYQRTTLNLAGDDKDPFRIGDGPIPLPFNLRKQDLIDRFVVESSDLEVSPENALGLKLTPKKGLKMDADVVYLWFDKQTMRPVQARADDLAAGEIKIIRLLKPEWNADLSAETFSTDPPPEAKPPAWSVTDEAVVG